MFSLNYYKLTGQLTWNKKTCLKNPPKSVSQTYIYKSSSFGDISEAIRGPEFGTEAAKLADQYFNLGYNFSLVQRRR